MAKQLASVTISRTIDGYQLEIEDDTGATLTLLADEDQLTELAEEIERAEMEDPPQTLSDEDADEEPE